MSCGLTLYQALQGEMPLGVQDPMAGETDVACSLSSRTGADQLQAGGGPGAPSSVGTGQHPSCLCDPPGQQIFVTAGDVGTGSLGVHTGIPRPGSWPRVTQLPRGAPQSPNPILATDHTLVGRCWPLSLHCTLCFLTGDQCSDEAWLNHITKPSRMPKGHLFFLRRKQGSRGVQ